MRTEIDLALVLERTCLTCLLLGGALVLARFIGRTWLLGLFESEGQPSARIVVAVVISLTTLWLQSQRLISDNQAEANYFFAASLFGLGTGKLIATRFASRPPVPDTQIQAKVAPVNSQNTSITPPPDAPAQKTDA